LYTKHGTLVQIHRQHYIFLEVVDWYHILLTNGEREKEVT